MHYFSLHLPESEQHIGFFLLHAEDENQPNQGQFALKLNDDFHPKIALQGLIRSDEALFWQAQKDRVLLHDAHGNAIGHLQNQFVQLCGERFILNDLTGTL